MNIKNRIQQKLNEANELSHADKNRLIGTGADKVKPKFRLDYHGQQIQLKSKTKAAAKKEAILYAGEHGFKPHHATLIQYYPIDIGMGRTSNIEEKIPLPFTP